VYRFELLTVLTLLTGIAMAGSAPLDDPIPAKIPKGDIRVGVVAFTEVPRTTDSSHNFANQACARIQYLQPFGNTFGTLAINDTRGVIYLTDERGTAPTVYLDLREQGVGFDDSMFPNEMGLSGVAFHPEFTSMGLPGFGKFYTAYSARSDSGVADYLEDDSASHESVIREWTAANPRGRTFEGTSREIFRVGQFAPNHNIGNLAFNPIAEVGSADYGVLYASFGDGGVANDPRENGQSLAVPLSTIIRINPLADEGGAAYGIPDDNPFLDRDGAAPEIFVYGLRHPQHFSWDSRGRLFISDIGQNQVEEVNLGAPGANYGWRLREGTFATAFSVADGQPGRVYGGVSTPDGLVDPIAQYDHDEGNAISGGFVYEGNAIPELVGKFVFSDLVTGRLFYIDAEHLEAGRQQPIRELRLVFDGTERPLVDVSAHANTYAPGARVDLRLGQDALGELYLLTKGDCQVRKLVPAPQSGSE
jgi:glucose/arabinose dehydrogenase